VAIIVDGMSPARYQEIREGETNGECVQVGILEPKYRPGLPPKHKPTVVKD